METDAIRESMIESILVLIPFHALDMRRAMRESLEQMFDELLAEHEHEVRTALLNGKTAPESSTLSDI